MVFNHSILSNAGRGDKNGAVKVDGIFGVLLSVLHRHFPSMANGGESPKSFLVPDQSLGVLAAGFASSTEARMLLASSWVSTQVRKTSAAKGDASSSPH